MDILGIRDPDPHENLSGSRFEFYEFLIRIHAQVQDPCGSGSNPYYSSIFERKTHTKFYQKEESINHWYGICHFLFLTVVLHNPEFTEK